ncbi:MAG TPA: protein kinase [Candidatus Acidoferrum sp.]|jgi:serine/threonine protein kinase/Tfp pilus assembly protein PilF
MTEDPKSKPPHNAADDQTLSYSNAPGESSPAPTGVPLLETPPNAVFAPDQILAGRFKVIRFIARGGMGEVYEAEDQELNERVAVKTARFKNSQDARDVERFRREIQLARKVTHPNVCRTFDIFRHTANDSATGASGETLLVTMELLEGKSLDKRVRGPNRMTTIEALHVVVQMCAGLQAAHNAGVIHRDFKSSNVMLVSAPAGASTKSASQGALSSQAIRVVITDFGLAHTEEHHGQSLTHTGDIVGTPAYMSPEQIEGGLVTPATDIYSLGIVMYEMLTGELPFSGDTPLSTAIKRLKAPAPSPRLRIPDLDEKWEYVVARCLEREPEQRFANTDEIVDVLRGGAAPARLANASASAQYSSWGNASASVNNSSAGATTIQVSPFHHWRWPAVIIAIALLATASVWISARYRKAPGANLSSIGAVAPGAARKSVAIIGFANLSQRKDANSLGNVLVDSLLSQLDTDQLRFVPTDRVNEMKQDLALSDVSGAISQKQAEAIRKYLGADVLINGSYNVTGQPQHFGIQWNIHLLNAADGQSLGSISQPGTESDLNDLVVHTGRLVRQKFGIQLSAEDQARLDASLSSNADAVTAFSEAQEKLRTFDLPGATRLLQQAIDHDPQFAKAHSALSGAWDALGFEAKATEEAKKAVDVSGKLSSEARDLISARFSATSRDWPKAIQQYAQLWTQYRDEPEYGLLLANTQIRAGKPRDALTTIAQARSQNPPPGIQAQIDLAEAQAHDTLGDYPAELKSATSAAERAQSLRANLLLARARIAQCIAHVNMVEISKATPLCEEAKKLNLDAGDQFGAARATNQIAKAYYNAGNYDAAEQLYRDALGIAQSIGDKYDEAGALNNLANIQSTRGDTAGARKTYEQSIAVAQERGELGDAALARQNLGLLFYSTGDAARGNDMFTAALKTARDIGDRNLEANLLLNRCEVGLSYGALTQARTDCEKSLQIWRSINDRIGTAKALSNYGSVQLQGGDPDSAVATLQQAVENLDAAGAKNDAAWSRIALSAALLNQHRTEEARTTALAAATELEAEKDVSSEAEARIAIANALLAAGNVMGAREQTDKALALAKQSDDRGLGFDAAIAAARVDTRSGKSEDAIKALSATQKNSRAAGLVQGEFEARLALGEAQIGAGQKKDGAATLQALAKEAKARGYGLIARKAAASPQG